ncbi:hypothetical protein JOC75_000933 [Metabacillus crassostreae]|uniref:nucleotidyltransferase family protein n=1 Tax=Metabacillus crassostreae TaxID=929098 RepID=UPI00195C535B|nr:nucleotidyltransferase family protein [Metabacillus crassostreae]MBM7602963.1 hypothetical protein [Metabacillus crassostreae]
MNEEDIISIIRKDEWMMEALRAAKSLELQDWWICAGFIRSKIWDTLHNFSVRTKLPDVDLIYFNPSRIDEVEEKELEKRLKTIMPFIPWSVKNQARMHIQNNFPPYSSTIDAISKFPETATALGVKLDHTNNVILTYPCGLNDVVNLVVRPTAFFTKSTERMEIYEQRIATKNWQYTWNHLKVYHIDHLIK